MSTIKVDVQWSPVDDDIFTTYGAAICLYKAKEKNGTYEVFYQDSRTNYENTKIIQLATNSELQFMKCVAWCPRRDSKNIFAVAQTSGRISFIGLDHNVMDDLIGKEFNVRYSRQCNYLAWNPVETHLLAQGLERGRSEPCVLIWDINSSNNNEVGERSRYSFSEGPITKPAHELGSGEASASFAWSDSKTFLVGMANKHIRLYDLRDTNKPHMNVQHRCVAGICIEPTQKQRIASFHENHIAIWDLRSFDRPINTITESKNVVKLSWCPIKNGILSVLTKESPFVKLHDIRHSVFGSDELEQASVERNVQPFGKSNLSSFCWHPRHENRLLAVLPNGNLRDMTVYERIPMEWSTNLELTMPFTKEIIHHFEEKGTEKDISTVMRKRLSQNYGLNAHSIESNMKAVKDEPTLLGLWRWILNVKVLTDAQVASSCKYHIPPATGIISLLHMDKEEVLLNSEPVGVHWKASESVKYSKRTHYRSNERIMALQLCGWVPDHPKEDFDGFIESLVRGGNPERASAIALFYLHIKRALDILSKCAMSSDQGEGKPSLQAVAMALSGFTEDPNALWRRTCGTLRYQLENPYLRAMFAFLACEEDNYEDVLNEEVMSVEDRIAFALIYLPDAKLKTYLCKLSDELTKTGDLDGIVLTGLLHNKGIELLGNFVDRTADVQTAAIAVIFSKSSNLLNDVRVTEWIDVYRDLLDRWRFWFQRAQFDNIRQTLIQERVPPQVHVACNFCGKSISPNLSVMNRLSIKIQTVFSSRGPTVRPKITCCPSCRKALPRCAVCLAHMGTSSAIGLESGSKAKLVPFQEWFSWCMTCRHGGHAGHLREWFSQHGECPVTGCVCKCASLDSVNRLKAQPLNKGIDAI
ncbi:GATOR complex protein MIOS-A-like [Biomphalaria glabrata]|uniref:GATOR complex protein MIOS-A-like n=1 Tax=Biomphalaria glabrata TaxID=6526 RepID=A0A9W2ZQT9_BIOGL|nr:GATOR complex protein MIOS-A-like [Biomphalaria glabrata]